MKNAYGNFGTTLKEQYWTVDIQGGHVNSKGEEMLLKCS